MIEQSSTRLVCTFCCEEYDLLEDDVDRIETGFWCDLCEGFSFFDHSLEAQRKFTLILEGKAEQNEYVHASRKIKLNKRLSPLRYPGGKSKLADYILSHINTLKTDILCSL